MKQFKIKNCKNCNTVYQSTGPAAKYCVSCSLQSHKDCEKRGTIKYRIKNNMGQIGVGKGGANLRFEQDNQFKTGICYFQKNRRRIKAERKKCERCSKFLLDAGKGQWCVHHKDHNRSNNVDSNFELLCKKCHQLEHNCIANLPKLKVRRSESNLVGDSVSEAPGIQ